MFLTAKVFSVLSFLLLIVFLVQGNLVSIRHLMLIKSGILLRFRELASGSDELPNFIQCNVPNPLSIFTQPTKMDAAGRTHVFQHVYSLVLNKEEIGRISEGME